MTEALTRVGEIRTQIATLQDVAAGRTTATAGTATATSAATQQNATQFASALAAATGTDLTNLTAQLPGTPAPGVTTTQPLGGVVGAATTTGTGTATSAPASTDAGAAKGQQIVETAKEYLGTPYVWGGESLAEGGLDCSGLVHLTYSRHGIDLPRVARDQMREGTTIGSLAEARAGDLIIQRGGKHVGIYLGDGQMIHSPRPGKTVEIASITDDRVTTIRRILD
ncbi:C40 family peptidase [Isoptericola sp. NEAU-Y5]|uniref:C40 family peptidase n=1 Tax=Isoptericola luteus TaxID=2879484 RepID=A0ABS7ZMX4_9MICO|nr:C40 family peptidase [Isoptericola sp. NEAU-Y5]MCA5895130.1 C40 family peptidase [Isoptericola sp. NEAU-Y5]